MGIYLFLLIVVLAVLGEENQNVCISYLRDFCGRDADCPQLPNNPDRPNCNCRIPTCYKALYGQWYCLYDVTRPNCGGDLPYCNNSGFCVQCITDEQCAGVLQCRDNACKNPVCGGLNNKQCQSSGNCTIASCIAESCIYESCASRNKLCLDNKTCNECDEDSQCVADPSEGCVEGFCAGGECGFHRCVSLPGDPQEEEETKHSITDQWWIFAFIGLVILVIIVSVIVARLKKEK